MERYRTMWDSALSLHPFVHLKVLVGRASHTVIVIEVSDKNKYFCAKKKGFFCVCGFFFVCLFVFPYIAWPNYLFWSWIQNPSSTNRAKRLQEKEWAVQCLLQWRSPQRLSRFWAAGKWQPATAQFSSFLLAIICLQCAHLHINHCHWATREWTMSPFFNSSSL